LIGTIGIEPETALWMTPREMHAAAEGWGRRERTRFVTMARAFGSEISEQQAEQIIDGKRLAGLSHKEQEEKYQAMKRRNNWN